MSKASAKTRRTRAANATERSRPVEPGAGPVPAFFSTQVGQARRMYLDLNPSPNAQLAVVCAGVEHCSPEFEICRERFSYFCIEYVLRGRGTLTLGTQTSALKSGDVFAYTPKTPHVIVADAQDPFLKYFVDFTGKRAAQLLRDSGLSSGRVMRLFPPDSLSPLFDELIGSGQAAGTKAGALCMKLLECIALKIATASTPPDVAKSRAFTTYQHCKAHLEEHCLRLKSLDQLAQECRIDKAYMCQLFRRFDHMSPYQSLLHFKVNAAAGALQKPGALVKDVAAAVGFSDPLHFSRLFHRTLGVWPSDFRGLR